MSNEVLEDPERRSREPWKALFRGLFGIALGALLFYLAVRNVDWSDVRGVLGRAQPIWLLAGMAVYAVDIALRALRWFWLLKWSASIRFPQVLLALVVGYGVNNLLPARLGELYRADFVARRYGSRRSRVLGAIFVERLLDVVCIAAMLGLGLLLVPRTGDGLDLLDGVLLVAVTGAFVLIIALGALLRKAPDLELSRFPRLGRMVGDFAHAVDVRRSTHRMQIGLISILIWTAEAFAYWLILLAFGKSIDVSTLALLVGAASLSTVIPTGPAYLGSYQLAFVIALSVAGYSETLAIIAATAVQLALMLPLSAIAIVQMMIEGSSDLRSRKQLKARG